MTKKAMIEKYTKVLEQNQNDKQLCKDSIIQLANNHFTEKELNKMNTRQIALELLNKDISEDIRKEVLRDYSTLQKLIRECTLLNEILSDLK